MEQVRISIRNDVHASPIRESDKPELVRLLNDRSIYDTTLRIPFPYTDDDADFFLNIVQEATTRHGHPIHFAIRDPQAQLIGGYGFEGLTYGHRAEIGYWLGQPYWNRGIMTAAVQVACELAIQHWKLVRITAHVFDSNRASARVLEKCGFQCEGFLKKHLQKDGQFIDCKLFALVR